VSNTYINYGDLVGRYKELAGIGGAVEINSHYIHYAERQIEARLGNFFTAPFSDNNITIKDLCIDMTYARYYSAQEKGTDKLKAIKETIAELINGTAAMVTDDGTIVQTDGASAFSSTEQYTPTFGHGPVEDMVVDPDLLADEEAER